MSYSNYTKGLKNSLIYVSNARKAGVVLSRIENFDNMFKRELAIRKGIRKNHKVVANIVNYVGDYDYRLAKFFAESLDLIMFYENGDYTFKDIMDAFKYIIKSANRKAIFTKRVKVFSSDKNGAFNVAVTCKEYGTLNYTITSKDDLSSALINLVGVLGSSTITDIDYSTLVSKYLVNVYMDITMGKVARPLVHRDGNIVDLSSYKVNVV